MNQRVIVGLTFVYLLGEFKSNSGAELKILSAHPLVRPSRITNVSPGRLNSVEVKRESVDEYYDVLEQIGSGAFGAIHRCREKRNGNMYAAKIITTDEEAVRNWTREEIDIMNELNHSKLLRLYNAFEDPKRIVLILEL